MNVFRLLVLIVVFAIRGLYSSAEANVGNAATPRSQMESKPKKSDSDYDGKYAAYSMDGVTSASKLAAQRSHTVSGKDERNFAIFSGITVVFIIYFVTQFKFFDK